MSLTIPQGFVIQPDGSYAKPSKKKIYENTNTNNSPLCPTIAEPRARLPLEDTRRPEETNWHDDTCRFEIWFTIYSVRPADWDGYDIKSLQDFCVTAGILPSDGWKFVSGGCTSKKAATEEEEKTVVEIKAIKAENQLNVLEVKNNSK